LQAVVTLPSTLSPSKASTFTQCPRRYRYTAIELLREPPTVATLKGTVVHAALEGLFSRHPRGTRGRDAAMVELERALEAARDDGSVEAAGITEVALVRFERDARALVEGYLQLEDPNEPQAVAVEAWVAAAVGGTLVRGIIDRLDLQPDGSLVVVDYKTGRVPSPRYEQDAFTGLATYAMLLQEELGRIPVELRLLYLAGQTVLTRSPTVSSVSSVRRRTVAIWSSISAACASDTFPARPSALCRSCAFASHCPGPPPS
jgi:putative RecB family exonuclease